MRIPLLIAVVGVLAALPAHAQTPSGLAERVNTSAAVAKDLNALQGEWKCVSWVVNGTPTPKAELDKMASFEMRGNEMIAKENGNDIAAFSYTIDPTKTPKTIDGRMASGPEVGKKSVGIYELDADTWRTCWSGFGKALVRPTAFTSEPGSGTVLGVYRRVKK
jgi:uncharacterized protein (TIGR03067 family)